MSVRIEILYVTIIIMLFVGCNDNQASGKQKVDSSNPEAKTKSQSVQSGFIRYEYRSGSKLILDPIEPTYEERTFPPHIKFRNQSASYNNFIVKVYHSVKEPWRGFLEPRSQIKRDPYENDSTFEEKVAIVREEFKEKLDRAFGQWIGYRFALTGIAKSVNYNADSQYVIVELNFLTCPEVDFLQQNHKSLAGGKSPMALFAAAPIYYHQVVRQGEQLLHPKNLYIRFPLTKAKEIDIVNNSGDFECTFVIDTIMTNVDGLKNSPYPLFRLETLKWILPGGETMWFKGNGKIGLWTDKEKIGKDGNQRFQLW